MPRAVRSSVRPVALAKSALPSAIMRTLPAGLLVAAPGAHHEGVVDRHAPDLVDAGGLQLVGLLDVARHVLGRAGRREGAGQAEDRDRLAGRRLRDVERVRADACSRCPRPR